MIGRYAVRITADLLFIVLEHERSEFSTGGFIEDLVLLGCETVSLLQCFPDVSKKRNVFTSSATIKAAKYAMPYKTSVNSDRETERHIS